MNGSIKSALATQGFERSTVSAVAAPDRRFRRFQWRVILVTMFCYLFYYTGRQVIGFAIPGIQAELGWSKVTLGWISSAMLWSYAIGQAINGNLADQFGGRRMVSLGAVLSCGLNWMVSFASAPFTFGVTWAGNGFAQSMGWAPGSKVISSWWSHAERGKAYGLYTLAAGSASVLAYVTSNLVLHAGLNWRWIFRLPVLLMLVGGAAYFLLIRDRPTEAGFTEESAGSESAAELLPAESALHRYRVVLGNWRFLLAGLAIGFQNAARYGLLVWVPVYFLGTDWKDSPTGSWITVALPVGMALGAITSGWMSDRLFSSNRSVPIALFLLLATLSTGATYLVGRAHPWTGLPLLFLSGFFVYGPQAPFWALCPDLLGKDLAGTGTGALNTFAYAFAGLSEPLIGRIIERNHDDASLAFVVVAVACLCGSGLASMIRR